MPPKIIELKCWSPFIEEVKDLKKPFEVRRLDRPYEPGCWLHLRQWKPGPDGTGEGVYGDLHIIVPVTMIVELAIVPGLVDDVARRVMLPVEAQVERGLDNWGVLGLDLRMIQVVRSDAGAAVVEGRIRSGELVWTP